MQSAWWSARYEELLRRRVGRGRMKLVSQEEIHRFGVEASVRHDGRRAIVLMAVGVAGSARRTPSLVPIVKAKMESNRGSTTSSRT